MRTKKQNNATLKIIRFLQCGITSVFSLNLKIVKHFNSNFKSQADLNIKLG